MDKFIAKQFLLLFAGTFFICQFVLMMQFLWRYVDELIGKGLSMEILAQFFWYMGLMLIPQALPLAILLSALITFGNLGESFELTAIKAAGVSLMQVFRPLIFIVSFITLTSFYFQNVVGPNANVSFAQLLLSMKQKSPELEIPEGVFYDGIPQTNIYVEKKDVESGMLYGIMIYRMNSSFEDAAVILADSGMMQSTAEKKHLMLTLYGGEWFENMRSQELAGNANVPYRRESFVRKRIVLDFDADFNLADAGGIMGDARAKGLARIRHDYDSLKVSADSIGDAFYKDVQSTIFSMAYPNAKPTQTGMAQTTPVQAPRSRVATEKNINLDTLYARQDAAAKQQTLSSALSRVTSIRNDLEFKSVVTADADKTLREHQIEAINKFVLSLSCLIFFFIGAPLGAIIRKGGLGVPVIISVLVFIIFYILDNTGYRMARAGQWPVWLGKSLATAVLAPTAIFVTIKANKDSNVFNMDAYMTLMRHMLGLRTKRSLTRKEVIIMEPQYTSDAAELDMITTEIVEYSRQHNLKSWPNPKKVFFEYEQDNVIEDISDRLEAVISDLSNTRDRSILTLLNHYPTIMVKAHTRPFDRKWMNVACAVIVPLGIFFYIRMLRFRLRLLRDLRVIKRTNDDVRTRISEMEQGI